MLHTDEQFVAAWESWGRERSVARQMKDLVAGDSCEVLCWPDIPRLWSGTARTITKAWLSLKAKPTDSDATENDTWSPTAGARQAITTTNVAGRGQIQNASEGTPELRFDVTATNTAAMEVNRLYYFDVQVLMSDGSLYTVERGTCEFRKGVTQASA